ncbi:L-isoaspartyl protein carboxyl methyltransferase [bacterium]|nr:L-isoaspartyl protein carboxyl methyltransferase [bacterium]
MQNTNIFNGVNKETLLQKLKDNNFSDKIVQAFSKVDRSVFIPPKYQGNAYQDIALPIGQGQTISQPYTIAFMLNLLELEGKQRILEVGSGSGYVLALLNQLSKNSKIFGTEKIYDLVERSQIILDKYNNIKIVHTPDTLGLSDQGLFDRILVSAAADQLPTELLEQLDNHGVLVCPVRNSIIKACKEAGKIKAKEYPGFAFVPLITS